MQTNRVTVPDESMRDYLKSVLNSISQHSNGSETQPPKPHKPIRASRPPTVLFTLFRDGYCSDFRTRNCGAFSANHPALQAVKNAVPFAKTSQNWKSHLEVEIEFSPDGLNLDSTFVEEVNADSESLKSILQAILTIVSGDLRSLEFKNPHSMARLSFNLGNSGHVMRGPDLSESGVIKPRTGGLAALKTLKAASPFGTLPDQCSELSVLLTVTENGIFISGHCL